MSPPLKREQGRPGARCTRGLACHKCANKTHTSIQVQRKHSGLPCAMALRLMPCSLRRRIRLVTVTAGLMTDRSGRIDLSPTAWHQQRVSRPHGFAVRFSAVRLARDVRSRITALRTRFAPDASASTASRPAFVTTRDPPLLSEQDGVKITLDTVRRKATYFCERGWTTQITLKSITKSQPARSAFLICRAQKPTPDAR